MQGRKQHRGTNNKDIFFDDLTCPQISNEMKTELESVTNLLCLSLNNCKLESLENFPKIPSLIRLEIMDNSFPGEHLAHLTALSSLQSLSLANNKISDFNQLKPLTQISNLVQLDLSECPISEKPDYRKTVFSMLEKLHILDNLDEEGKPFEYSGESEAENEEGGEEEDEDEQEDFEVDPNATVPEEDLVVPQDDEQNGNMAEPTEPLELKKTKLE